ncbi:CDGSH iron-sulfur domain-containing protein [Kineococcus sp. SYSU DK002]|uniref:CDGSH iron-sulfur domain-containing protein n=1 Tax=Kineococcus sp. SYSU DK002 TaxID=3383123 RepID=UPI003D7D80F0
MGAERVARVLVSDDGPVLLEGPVDIDLPDGRRVRSDRPVTALCVCRRSARYPLCDTSHRGRPAARTAGPADATPEPEEKP